MRIWRKKPVMRAGIGGLIGLLWLAFPAVSYAMTPDFQTKILANGLKIIYKVQPQANTVCARMVIPAGLMHEPPQAHGVSYLLTHLIHRGSAKISARELSKLVDGEEGYCHSFVYPDRTEYAMETLPANFIPALSIYTTFILQPGLAESDIRLEKRRVSIEKAPYSTANDTFLLYMNGLTQPQFADALQGITRDDLIKYHQQFYRTGLLTVILTGAFNPDEVFKLLKNLPPTSGQALPSTVWPFRDPAGDIVLEDYLAGEKYQVWFGFDLRNMAPRDLAVAKVLPYILEYESHQYDHVNDRPLDYHISLFNFNGHYFLVFQYRDTVNSYSLAMDEWHQKNLMRYFKYLQAKNLDNFLAKFSRFQSKLLESLTYDPVSLNEYLTITEFDSTGLTAKDWRTVGNLSSKHFQDFVQKYLTGKYYQKIVIKAL